MINTIKRQEEHRTQIIARLPGPCQSAMEDRFGASAPECVECRRLLINHASYHAESPEVLAERLRHHMGTLSCSGGNHLRREAAHMHLVEQGCL